MVTRSRCCRWCGVASELVITDVAIATGRVCLITHVSLKAQVPFICAPPISYVLVVMTHDAGVCMVGRDDS